MKKLKKTLEVPLFGGFLRCQSKESIFKAIKRAHADDPSWSKSEVRVIYCNEWDKKHFRRGLAFRFYQI